MPKHDHTECTHEIKLCSHCDVVYCGLCSKEWSQHVTLHSPHYFGEVFPLDPLLTNPSTTTNPVPETTQGIDNWVFLGSAASVTLNTAGSNVPHDVGGLGEAYA